MKTILFDLDGTLLPMELEEFVQYYFQGLSAKFASMGYDGAKLPKLVWAGTQAMFKNDGSICNEDCFWNTFTAYSQIPKEDVIHQFEDFYHHEFQSIADVTTPSENMIEVVRILKEKGYQMVIATNPLFPKIASESRVRWAGLQPEDFLEITTYEDYHACKPNPQYFLEVLEKNGLRKEDVLMHVGNDAQEDGVAETLGIPVYLVTDHLINRKEGPLHTTYHSTSSELLEFVKQLPNV